MMKKKTPVFLIAGVSPSALFECVSRIEKKVIETLRKDKNYLKTFMD